MPCEVDPWERADECAKALLVCEDCEQKLVIGNLRQMWVKIGNQKAAGEDCWEINAEDVAKMHATIMGQS